MTGAYPDAEQAIADLISGSGLLNAVGVGDSPPSNVAYRLPYGLVYRSGGADDGITDAALVDVEVYVHQRSNGRDLSEQIRQRLVTPGRPPYPLDRITTVGAIQELPSGGRHIRRWTATYRVAARRTT